MALSAPLINRTRWWARPACDVATVAVAPPTATPLPTIGITVRST